MPTYAVLIIAVVSFLAGVFGHALVVTGKQIDKREECFMRTGKGE